MWALQIIRILITEETKSNSKYVISSAGWYHNTDVDAMTPQFVKIGSNFVSGPKSQILTHDSSCFLFAGKYRIEPVEIVVQQLQRPVGGKSEPLSSELGVHVLL